MTEIDVELRHVSKLFTGRNNEGNTSAVNDISLEIPSGEFFTLLGPSGCGKPTTLRMIAGFEEPTSGEILIRGRQVQGVPPFHRPVNTVFQDYALFPHMTVLQNVMFGLQMERVSTKDAEKRARSALEMVRLPQAANRLPRQLSGGQQQRVALARAIVKQPEVLLLDEPLGALDLKLRKELQFELKQMQQNLGITFVYVTHDQEEALTMADRIAVMNQGNVLQVGTPEEIYETPRTRFVADFIGETNFMEGTLLSKEADPDVGCKGTVELQNGVRIIATLSDPDTPEGTAITVGIRPEKINLFVADGRVKFPDGTSDDVAQYRTALERDPDINIVPGVIQQAVYIGTDTRYIVEIAPNVDLVVRQQNFGLRSDRFFRDGQRVNVFWDMENSRVLTE